MPITAVSFDLDGTLAAVRWRQVGLWRDVLREGRVLLAWSEAVRQARGSRSPALDRALALAVARRLRRDPREIEAILAAVIEERWPRCFTPDALLPAAAALIQAVDQAGLARAVVSDHAPIAKLQAMQIGGRSAAISCRALGALKPLPDGLHAAAAQLGIQPSNLLHVGDRWDTDGRAAAAAGCAFRHISQINPRDPLQGLQIGVRSDRQDGV